MNKKDFKKANVHFGSGYAGNGAVVNISLGDSYDIVARVELKPLEEMIEKAIRDGKFEFSTTTKGRKYQYLVLK